MKCEFCQTENESGALFCIECGRRLPAEKPTEKSTETPIETAVNNSAKTSDEDQTGVHGPGDSERRVRKSGAQKKGRAFAAACVLAVTNVVCIIVAIVIYIELDQSNYSLWSANRSFYEENKTLKDENQNITSELDRLMSENQSIYSELSSYHERFGEISDKYEIDITGISNGDSERDQLSEISYFPNTDVVYVDLDTMSPDINWVYVDFDIMSPDSIWPDDVYINLYRPDGTILSDNGDDYTWHLEVRNSEVESHRRWIGFRARSEGLYLLVFYQDEEVIGHQGFIISM